MFTRKIEIMHDDSSNKNLKTNPNLVGLKILDPLVDSKNGAKGSSDKCALRFSLSNIL